MGLQVQIDDLRLKCCILWDGPKNKSSGRSYYRKPHFSTCGKWNSFYPGDKTAFYVSYNDNRHLNTQRIDPIFFRRLEHGDDIFALTSRMNGIGRRKDISPAGGGLADGLLNRFNHCFFFPERKKIYTIDIPEHAGLSP